MNKGKLFDVIYRPNYPYPYQAGNLIKDYDVEIPLFIVEMLNTCKEMMMLYLINV